MFKAWLLVFHLATGEMVEIDTLPSLAACQEEAVRLRPYYSNRWSCIPENEKS